MNNSIPFVTDPPRAFVSVLILLLPANRVYFKFSYISRLQAQVAAYWEARTMLFGRMLIQLALAFVVIRADEGSSSGDAGTRSGGGSFNSAGGGITFVPAEVIQAELLNTADIAPDTMMVLASSYGALDDGALGLSAVTAPDTTVAASVLIVPPSMGETAQAFGNETDTKSVEDLSERTQLMYNCTSASNLWNLLEDPNVLKLEEFQQFPGYEGVDGSSFGSSSSSTTGLRESMTIALIEVADCFSTQSSSMGRPVVLNSFFDPAMNNTPAVYLYVENSTILGSSVGSDLPWGDCTLRLEMRRASLAEVYPQCKIRFHSTDLDNILKGPVPVPVPNSDGSISEHTRRRLGASSFAFVKDLSCYYECGAEGADSDKCYDYSKLTLYKCKMKFYSKNGFCMEEIDCGDKTGLPFGQPPLPANKCYDCYTTLLSCAPGYEKNTVGCCRKLNCPEIPETDTVTPTTFTYNLGADRNTINTPSIEIYSSGDCSNLADLTSNCCRVTCENCFFNLSIASMYVDVDVYPASFEVYTATEMKMVGNSNLQLKLFAPNGCLRPAVPLKSIPAFPTVSMPLGQTGLFIEANFTIELAVEISVKPHRSSLNIGSTQTVEVKTGQVNGYDFLEQLIQTTTPSDLAKTGIDVTVEFSATPTALAAISLLKIGKVGIKTGVPLFLRLEAAIKYPTPFDALPILYYDQKSWFRGGNCAKPHFVRYNIIGGFRPLAIVFFCRYRGSMDFHGENLSVAVGKDWFGL